MIALLETAAFSAMSGSPKQQKLQDPWIQIEHKDISDPPHSTECKTKALRNNLEYAKASFSWTVVGGTYQTCNMLATTFAEASCSADNDKRHFFMTRQTCLLYTFAKSMRKSQSRTASRRSEWPSAGASTPLANSFARNCSKIVTKLLTAAGRTAGSITPDASSSGGLSWTLCSWLHVARVATVRLYGGRVRSTSPSTQAAGGVAARSPGSFSPP